MLTAAYAVCLFSACDSRAEQKAGATAPSEASDAESSDKSEDVTGSAESIPVSEPLQNAASEEQTMEKELTLTINGQSVTVEWEENGSVEALKDLVGDKPLTIQMSAYGGFEQVGPLGTSLPRNDVQTETQAGDVVLYSGDQIVVFYGSNSWAYTRLGHITDKSTAQMKDLLGNGNVTIVISMERIV